MYNVMWQRKFGRLLPFVKGIVSRYQIIQQRRLIRFLLLPTGIIGVLVIMFVVPLNYTPDTSVPLPYIPPPPNGYYIEATLNDISNLFAVGYEADVPVGIEKYIGESLIFKNILITTDRIVTRKIQPYIPGEGLAGWETETFVIADMVQFLPQDTSDLKKLKAGDKVDIIGICAGMSKEWITVAVTKNCQFLPVGVASLPLPGGPVIIGGY